MIKIDSKETKTYKGEKKKWDGKEGKIKEDDLKKNIT